MNLFLFSLLLLLSFSAVYDIDSSKRYALFSALAFCGDCLSSWSCKGAGSIVLTDLTRIQNSLTKASGYIGFDPLTNTIILSFRGSDNIQNWIQDFNFEKVPYISCLKCQIHAGFYADYLLLQPIINQRVQSLLAKYGNVQIVTTGHSLGAALAQICGLELKKRYGVHTTLHNFGSPRIGNRELAQFLYNNVDAVWRVTHNRDLVPHLPPDLPPFHYHHSAHEVFFDQEMKEYTVCNDSGEDITCSNKFAPNYDPNDHDFYFIHISQVPC